MKRQLANVKFVLLCMVVFSLACNIRFTPICIVLFTITWLIEGNFKRKLSSFMQDKYAMLFAGFYVLHIIGMLYTPDAQSGWFDLQVKMSFLIFPVVLASEGKIEPERQKMLIGAYVAGCMVNELICIGYATWRYYVAGEWNFLYSQLSLFLHPSYFSMYVNLALVLVFYVVTSPQYNLRKWERITAYSIVFFLEFLLLLLLSKLGLIVSILILLIIVSRFVQKKEYRLRVVMLIAGTGVVYVLAYQFIKVPEYSRINYAATQIVSGPKNISKLSTESTGVRYFIWQSAWHLIKDNPVKGVGTGYAKEALQEQYKKDKFEGALYLHLNAHDEYLQCGVELGIIGLLYLLLCLALPLFKTIKEHRYVYMAFILIIGISFLTESMFETQAGTIFYGLFNSLLMFNFVI